GGAEAAEQVNLERRRTGELVRRQLRTALVEIVCDAHRANRMRAGWAWSYLVELVDRRQHRTLSLFHDIQLGRKRRRTRWFCRGPLRSLLGGHGAAQDDGCSADYGTP